MRSLALDLDPNVDVDIQSDSLLPRLQARSLRFLSRPGALASWASGLTSLPAGASPDTSFSLREVLVSLCHLSALRHLHLEYVRIDLDPVDHIRLATVTTLILPSLTVMSGKSLHVITQVFPHVENAFLGPVLDPAFVDHFHLKEAWSCWTTLRRLIVEVVYLTQRSFQAFTAMPALEFLHVSVDTTDTEIFHQEVAALVDLSCPSEVADELLDAILAGRYRNLSQLDVHTIEENYTSATEARFAQAGFVLLSTEGLKISGQERRWTRAGPPELNPWECLR